MAELEPKAIEFENIPENPAVMAFESMYTSQDFKDALVSAWNEPKESSVREAMERGIIHVRHPYGMIYRFENYSMSGKDKNIVFGRIMEESGEFEAKEAIRFSNSGIVWSDERERNDWKYDYEIGPEAVKKAIRMAAVYFANSKEFRSLVEHGEVMDVFSHNLTDLTKHELGLILNHEPNDLEKDRLKNGVRGLDFNFYVFPKIEEQVGNYEQSLIMQKVISRRAITEGIRVQTGLNPIGRKGEFKVEYRLEKPLTSEQEKVIFEGIDPKFLIYGGKPLYANAH